MLKNNDIVILKASLDSLILETFCIGQIYKEGKDLEEFKVNMYVGGNSGLYEWFDKEDLLPLSEVVEGFYIKDFKKITKKQIGFIYYRYVEYLNNKKLKGDIKNGVNI